MTKKEKIIVSAYTGVLMCDFADLQKYAEEKFGRPCFTHEFAYRDFTDQLKCLAKPEFLELCKPKKTYVPLQKCCNCESKSYLRQFSDGFCHSWKCVKCGLTGEWAKTNKQSRENWNIAVETAKGEQNEML